MLERKATVSEWSRDSLFHFQMYAKQKPLLNKHIGRSLLLTIATENFTKTHLVDEQHRCQVC
jgi:hypothetical protein